MIDLTIAQLALRNRAISLSAATTGSTSLSATSTGYARAAGSFITDGFAPGMEVTPTGFTQTAVGVVDRVGFSATFLPIVGGRTAQAVGSGRTLATRLPALRAWEEIAFTPVSGRPYVEEDMVPATTQLITFPAASGRVEETGLYVLRLYGPSGMGIDALRKTVDALKALFAPGTAFSLSDGNTIRVRPDLGPFAGQIRPVEGGWSVVTLTIPWLARSVNTIAA